MALASARLILRTTTGFMRRSFLLRFRSVILRCERSEPRRMTGTAVHPSRRALGAQAQDAGGRLSITQLHGDAREQRLIGLAVGHRDAGVARALDAAVERDPLVIAPQVLLRRENLEGLVFRLPDFVDLQDEIGLVVALLRLVRLEQID